MNYILETKNISKEFPGVKALNNINLKIKKNELHAIVGENGAGKSTLVKILCGIYPYGTYNGELYLEGKLKKFYSTKDSEKEGISVVHQELSLFDELSVTENLFIDFNNINKNYINWNYLNLEAKKWLKKVGLSHIEPIIKVKELGAGEKQLLEIAKTLVQNPKILILDEPTSSLSRKETEILFNIIRELKQQGLSFIYISHKLEEIFELADTISVFRDGNLINTDIKENYNEDKIIKLMVGRDIKYMYPIRKIKPEEKIIFEVKSFNVYNKLGKKIVNNISFYLRKSEILGIFGLVGAGRSELVNSIYGSYKGKYNGEIFLEDRKLNIKTPEDSLKNGISLLTEERKTYGIIPNLTVRENISLLYLRNKLYVDKYKELQLVKEKIEKLKVKTSSSESKITTLSGGNQQKALLARNIMIYPKIIIIDEPTRGIDIGAKSEIYELMNEITADGLSIIMVSSELPEILGISDRILVMHEGNLVAEFDNTKKDITQEEIMNYAVGVF
ncbi:ATP-binding cassette domain-containing protein [Marinitoga sp. 38H-ov]|uniref:sugar ABC transporter ATP-binding protein n=1 Tax=Marinitoga sp. 38H-ov TaxID=1755814 RepID=UPI0016A433FF|nr:ATP-binding cassette domain-containing protein [Marinitoga sp. 38H-ov]KAF2956775.1 D-ribose transporter ATP-binding protein [Marinitoga sp. 38H-ov]